MCACACTCVVCGVCVCVHVLLCVKLHAASCSGHKSGHLLKVCCSRVVCLVRMCCQYCMYVCLVYTVCIVCTVCIVYCRHLCVPLPLSYIPSLPQRMETCTLGEKQAPTLGTVWRTPSSSDHGRWMPWCTDVCRLSPVATSTPLVSLRLLKRMYSAHITAML